LDSASDFDGLILLGDIGGTNARFALKSGPTLGPVVNLAVADHPRFDDALAEFLWRHAHARKVQAAVFAVAGPVRAGNVEFTNNNWTLDAQAIRATFGFERVSMVNDFAAVALGTVTLTK
jgi:glucokinase